MTNARNTTANTITTTYLSLTIVVIHSIKLNETKIVVFNDTAIGRGIIQKKQSTQSAYFVGSCAYIKRQIGFKANRPYFNHTTDKYR